MAMAVAINRRGGSSASISRARVRLRARHLLISLAVVAAVAAVASIRVINLHIQLQTTSSVALTAEIGDTNGSNATADVVVPSSKKGATPPCHAHALPLDCASDLCRHVGEYIKGRRDDRGMWHWYYPNILEYYKCTDARVIVEVGAAFGGQTQHMLRHGRGFVAEYHVVDPFLAGYDRKDAMSRWMQKAAPDATPADISDAWHKSLSLALGTLGEGLGAEDGEPGAPAGCTLRMHRVKSVEGARTFAPGSVDAVFVDGLHTYEGVRDDIDAWRDRLRPGGSMIFNDYNLRKQFGGISRAVKEEAERRGLTPRMIDRTNAVLGGKEDCATKPIPF